jgi:hypothetical protein
MTQILVQLFLLFNLSRRTPLFYPHQNSSAKSSLGYLAEIQTQDLLTFNVPLILKMQEIVFFCGQITLWDISRDILRGQDFFDLYIVQSRGPLKMSQEMSHKPICPKTKNNSPSFPNQQYIGNFYVPLRPGTYPFLCPFALYYLPTNYEQITITFMITIKYKLCNKIMYNYITLNSQRMCIQLCFDR